MVDFSSDKLRLEGSGKYCSKIQPRIVTPQNYPSEIKMR